MRNLRIFLVFLLAYLCWIAASSGSVNCRERERLVNTENGDLYMLVDVLFGEKITLNCHYCGENDDEKPRNWYKIDDFGRNTPAHEVVMDMSRNITNSKIHINMEHSLIINNFSVNDTGLYYCVRYESASEEEKFNYLLDLIENSSNTTEDEIGNLTAWQAYHDTYFVPMNELLANSKGEEYVRVRDELGLKMELVMQWRSWGMCEKSERSSLENTVNWRRNGKVLEPGRFYSGENTENNEEETLRIAVDTFHTLYLSNVKKSEEGNYTCQVDGVKMQQTLVFIANKSKIFTQEFVRHLIYLSLVLSLTIPLYCAGVVIACLRRRKFKGYSQLKEEEEERKNSHRLL